MDVLDLFFKKYSYKFEKGYPDLNNKPDILLLESILKQFDIEINLQEVKKPFESLSPKTQTIGQEIMDILNISKENIKADSQSRIIILTDENRNSVFTKLINAGFTRNPNIPGSSQGGVEKNNIQVIVKPLSKQGSLSAGKQNEESFNNLINSFIQQNDSNPITVIFTGNGKTLKYSNVSEAADPSTKGATEFDKSDTDLLDPSGNIIVGISLKKQNAVRWESSKRRPIDGVDVFKSFIEKVGKIGTEDEIGKFENVVLSPLEQKGKYKLTNPDTNQTLSKVIVKNTPSSVIRNVVFGDTNHETIVIKDTFEGGFNNYSYDENTSTLTINCYKIYTDVEDLTGTDDEPVFAFSNHIGQAYGIEFRSFSKGLLYKGDEPKGSSTEINFNDLK
jgi:hypothetical protein